MKDVFFIARLICEKYRLCIIMLIFVVVFFLSLHMIVLKNIKAENAKELVRLSGNIVALKASIKKKDEEIERLKGPAILQNLSPEELLDIVMPLFTNEYGLTEKTQRWLKNNTDCFSSKVDGELGKRTRMAIECYYNEKVKN